MSEELLVMHCSPTLAGIKTGNLFSCSFPNEYEMKECVRCWNRMLESIRRCGRSAENICQV